MGRLKGLDEMPERTGLEIEWSTILPGTYSGQTRPSRGGHVAKLVCAGLATLVVAAGVYAMAEGLVPSGRQIEAELERRAHSMFEARHQTAPLAADTRPIGSHQQAAPTTAESYASFPAGQVISASGPETAQMPALTIQDDAGDGLAKVVRIRSISGNQLWRTLYLAAGSHLETRLPAGGYAVTIAEGSTWRGHDALFTDEGRYYAPQNLDIRAGTETHIRLPPATSGNEVATTSRDAF